MFGGRTAHQIDTDPRQVNACIVDMTATTLQVLLCAERGKTLIHHSPLGETKGTGTTTASILQTGRSGVGVPTVLGGDGFGQCFVRGRSGDLAALFSRDHLRTGRVGHAHTTHTPGSNSLIKVFVNARMSTEAYVRSQL